MQMLETAANPWLERRRRALELREVYPHAAEMLDLQAALCAAQERAAELARRAAPGAGELPRFVCAEVLPGVIEATLAAGPERLRETVLERFHEADLEAVVSDWLAGREQSPADGYLARAATSPVLEALPPLRSATGRPGLDEQHCPDCGGLPQLSYFAPSPEALVTGPRQLVCSRCAAAWVYPRLCCAGCGSRTADRLPIFSDQERFASLRVDACEDCRHYLITVEGSKDVSAVPLVDEIAALPLDLYARELGFSKITTNLMGY